MIPWRTLLWVGALSVLFIWLAGTNGPGLLLGLGVLLAGTVLVLWRKQRAVVRSVLGDSRPPEKAFTPRRLICFVSGHKWRTAAEVPGPRDAMGGVSAVAYAGDGDDTVVLACQRCGHQKAVGVEDFRRFIGGPSGYGTQIDP